MATLTGVPRQVGAAQVGEPRSGEPRIGQHGAQRTFQLLLATAWLLVAVLQLQPFMFTRGHDGFSGMLNGMAPGNPGMLGQAIAWNASIVYHQPVLTNTLFAVVQFLIAFGIAARRTVKPALAVSVVWSLGVWWFGEGLGGLFSGRATPLGGGPGGVLFYAVLAVVLWPSDRTDVPFVAAKSWGATAARAIWAGVWGVLALLAVVGAGRKGPALHHLVDGLSTGEPGWLGHLDTMSGGYLLHHGGLLAILLAVGCAVTAVSVYLGPPMTRLMIVVMCVAFTVIGIGVQNLGGILAGGATDPNSAPLVVLFALAYWPFESWVRRPGAKPGPVSPTGGGI